MEGSVEEFKLGHLPSEFCSFDEYHLTAEINTINWKCEVGTGIYHGLIVQFVLKNAAYNAESGVSFTVDGTEAVHQLANLEGGKSYENLLVLFDRDVTFHLTGEERITMVVMEIRVPTFKIKKWKGLRTFIQNHLWNKSI